MPRSLPQMSFGLQGAVVWWPGEGGGAGHSCQTAGTWGLASAAAISHLENGDNSGIASRGSSKLMHKCAQF